ncbi:hypothetical protein [uncultured Abyssibacter sp.]|uniref:hypothetical protein n=1 Tax=uncultured Abyssibacter sp. TaxID=2320202 RepID=UPI0032B2AE66
MTTTTVDTSTAPGKPRLRAWMRGVLAGPLAFIASWILMAGAALYLPKGAAGIDNMVFPVVLFPLIWALLFLYSLLDRRLLRAYGVVMLLLAVHGGLIARHLAGAGA